MDFTISQYKELLEALTDAGYNFSTFFDFISSGKIPVAILRHDVDKKPRHALKLAQIEHNTGILSSYYFRILPCSFDPGVIRAIASMGHEIGYHYEDFSLSYGNAEEAIQTFQTHLNKLKEIAEVKTICMHG
ncbi:MAG: hypothetical protein V1904_04370, partial [Bacteroidota bacterium]